MNNFLTGEEVDRELTASEEVDGSPAVARWLVREVVDMLTSREAVEEVLDKEGNLNMLLQAIMQPLARESLLPLVATSKRERIKLLVSQAADSTDGMLRTMALTLTFVFTLPQDRTAAEERALGAAVEAQTIHYKTTRANFRNAPKCGAVACTGNRLPDGLGNYYRA